MDDALTRLRAPLGPDLLAHVLGARIGLVRHMCPECGLSPSMFCRWCEGHPHGMTTHQLDRWQAAHPC